MPFIAVNKVSNSDAHDDKDAPSSVVVNYTTVLPHSDESCNRVTAVSYSLLMLVKNFRILKLTSDWGALNSPIFCFMLIKMISEKKRSFGNR